MANLLESLRAYFLATNDRHTHFFDVTRSPYESPLKDHPKVFGSPGDQIHILDSFGDKRPVLFNHDFLSSNELYAIKFAITFILDSQLVSALHEFRVNRDRMKASRRAAVHDFVAYVSKLRYDYNPVFYFVESLFKSHADVFVDAVTPAATSLLYLHSMDEDHFENTGEIRLKPDALEFYFAKYHASTLEDCARELALWSLKDRDTPEMLFAAQTIYLCLLKMTLIHKKDDAPFAAKFDEYQDFVLSEVGLNLGREANLAAYYFANLAGGILPVQRGMNLQDAKLALRAMAWDLLLLRMPEYLLNPAHLPELTLAYVCSMDKNLIALGSLFTIEQMVRRSDSGDILATVVGFDVRRLGRKIGDAQLREISETIQRHVQARDARQPERPPPRADRMKAIVSDLEIQLSYLCKR